MGKLKEIIILCTVALVLCAATQAAVLFEDNFSAASIDTGVYYTEGAPQQAGGMLLISSSPDKAQERTGYTLGDGAVKRLEMRARFSEAPVQAGTWYGFARLGGTAIGTVLFGYHWAFGGFCSGSAASPYTQFDTTNALDPSGTFGYTDWHTFTIFSNGSNITFYIDGGLVATHPKPTVALTDTHVGMMKNEGSQPKIYFDWVRLTDQDGMTGVIEDGNIHGLVTNSVNGSPVAGVEISLNTGAATTTNLDGYYNITIAPGTYDVTASKSGFSGQTSTGNEVGPYGSVRVNLVVTPAEAPGTISGTVSDAAEGFGLPGVRVDVSNGDFTYSSDQGSYSLSLAPGKYDLTFTAMGYSTESRPEVAVNSNQTTDLDVAMTNNCQVYLYDDFNSAEINPDVWHTQGTPTLAGGTVKFGLGDTMESQATFALPGHTVEVRARWLEAPTFNAQWLGWMQFGGGDPRWIIGYWGGAFRVLTPSGWGPILDSQGATDLTQWHVYGIQAVPTATYVFMDGVQLAYGTTYPNVYRAGAFVLEGAEYDMLEVDWIRVSNCSLLKGLFVGSIGDAKKQANGQALRLDGNVVTAVFPDRLYIEDPKRAAGIEVVGSYSADLLGRLVNVSGALDKTGCHPKVVGATVTDVSAGPAILPVGSNNKPLFPPSTGADLQGMLVTAWGKITDTGIDAVGNAFFAVDDGSGLDGGSDYWTPSKRYIGFRVYSNIISAQTGDYMQLIGIAECGKAEGDTKPYVVVTPRDEVNDVIVTPL